MYVTWLEYHTTKCWPGGGILQTQTWLWIVGRTQRRNWGGKHHGSHPPKTYQDEILKERAGKWAETYSTPIMMHVSHSERKCFYGSWRSRSRLCKPWLALSHNVIGYLVYFPTTCFAKHPVRGSDVYGGNRCCRWHIDWPLGGVPESLKLNMLRFVPIPHRFRELIRV